MAASTPNRTSLVSHLLTSSLVSTGLTIFLLALALMAFQYRAARHALESQLHTLVGMTTQLAHNAELSLEQRENLILEQLRQHPLILEARVHHPENLSQTGWARPGLAVANRVHVEPTFWRKSRRLEAEGPNAIWIRQLQGVWHAKTNLAGKNRLTVELLLSVDASPLQRLWFQYLGFAVFALALSVFFSFVQYSRLRGLVVRPIESILAKVRASAETAESLNFDDNKEGSREFAHLQDALQVLQQQSAARNLQWRESVQQLQGDAAIQSERLAINQERLAKLLDDLRETRSRADAAEVAKNAFLINISHEIRTPLNGVIGMSELLSKTGLDNTQQRFCRTIRESSEALVSLVGNVLDLSNIESGKLMLASQPFALIETIETCVNEFAGQARDKGLALTMHYPDVEPVEVMGDSMRLRQVIGNLLSNAIKFTEYGEVSLRLSPLGDDWPTCEWRIEVQDTGIGIDPRTSSNLFDAFTQADDSATRQHGGSGIGLALCRALVELMGGDIGFTSRPRLGSTFWFTYKADEAALLDQDAPVPPLGLRVLLATPLDFSRDSLDDRLRHWQCEVITCANLGETLDRAIEHFHSAPFHWALVDEQLLNVQDPAAVEMARQLHANLSHGMLILNHHPDLDHNQNLTALGMGEIELPITASQLHQRLHRQPSSVAKPKPELANLLQTLSQPVAAPSEVVVQSTEPIPAVVDVAKMKPLVLLVEDNPINQEVARGMLELLHCEVRCADNGAEAITALKQRSFDLMLMDCQMPVLDGYSATRRIREDRSLPERKRQIPIIAVTANAVQGDRERCLEAGMNDYLPKPVRIEDLERKIQRWLASPTTHASITIAASHDRKVSMDQATSTAPKPPVLDPETVTRLRSLKPRSGPSLLVKLLASFKETCPAHIQKIVMGLENGDVELVRIAAHTMKGSTASVGALGYSEHFKVIETLAREGNLQPIPAMIDTLKLEFEAVRDALEAEAHRGE